MSKRLCKQYNPGFKLKVVLEVLKEEETVNQIASKYKVPPTNLVDWRKKFLENAEVVFQKDLGIKKYKKQFKEKPTCLRWCFESLGSVTK